jgi:N-acetylglucosaminyl-diphospho-decaprenol L-rhamnosyltransferase
MPAPRPSTVVLVLTYNSRASAVTCLESVDACASEGLTVHVIDNASTDDTVARLRARFPELRITLSTRNVGFGGGCNVGIETALEEGIDYVLLLNPDAVVAPDAIDRLVDFMEAHPRAGVVGAKTLSMEPMPDGSPRRLYAGSFRGRLPLRQRVPGIERTDIDDPAGPIEVDYIWGHGMLLRADALRQVGGFDPDFFMYYEDLDLCLRFAEGGFGVWCEPAALVWHDAPDGARAIRSEAWRWRFKAHSMALFHRKHHGALRGRWLSFCTGVVEAAQLLRQGHFRALGHQVASNLSCALGLARE